jgi:PAS domain S-box-containing protein
VSDDDRKSRDRHFRELAELLRRLSASSSTGAIRLDVDGLHRPEGLLRGLFASLSEGVVLVDRDGKVVQANPPAERILGLTRSEIEGGDYVHRRWDLVDGSGKPLSLEDSAGPLAMREKRPVREIMMGVKRPDGATAWISVNVVPLLDAADEVQGAIGTLTDVTKWRDAEAALRESEDTARAQYLGIPVPVYTWQRSGDDLELISYNTAALEITRGGITKYIGIKAREMYSSQREILDELHRCLEERTTIERTMPYTLKSIGETKQLSVRYAFVPPDMVMVCTEDVTERQLTENALRESEERLRSVISSMDDLVFVLDENRRFVAFYQPQKTAKLYAPPGEFIGKTLDEALPDDLARASHQAIDAVLATGEARQIDYSLDVEGDERWFSAKLSARHRDDGRFGGVTVVVREITGRVEAQHELEVVRASLERQVQDHASELAALRREAEQLATMRERERLARELHDAVTQTLFSVSLIADALPSVWERDEEEGRQRLAELRRMTRNALAEMRELLLELRPTAIVDAELSDLLQQLAEPLGERAGLQVEMEVDEAGPIPSDLKVALYRIAQEALNNVAKHASAIRAKVRLRSSPGRVLLKIEDDGDGFDPRHVEPGCMGLDIMRERADRAGARLTIGSLPRHGSWVVVEWTAPDDDEPE